MNYKIEINNSRTLKLENVITIEFIPDESDAIWNAIQNAVTNMELYIKQKGAKPIGPLIQKTSVVINDDGTSQMKLLFMRQAGTYMNHVEPPYSIDSVIKVQDCMYTRFIGEEESLKHAYNKIQLVAYEENIKLGTDTYTVFVDQNEEDGTMTADIFVPKCSHI